MEKRINPLFDDVEEKNPVLASEIIESVNKIPLSPITKKPMRKVACAGIPAYFDEESRLVVPIRTQ